MGELVRRGRLRTVVSWVEIIIGAGLTAAGIAYFAPFVQDTIGDPHGMGGALSLMFAAIGVPLLAAGSCLRIRAAWPWILQSLPVAVAVWVAAVLS